MNPEDVSKDFLPIIADLPLCCVVPTDERKLVLPIDGEPDAGSLLKGHFAGNLGPIQTHSSEGVPYVERRGRALAVRPVDGDGKCTFVAWDFDVGGQGHKCQTTAETAQAAACDAHSLLTEAGLPALLAASGGGSGRHVWCLLPASVPVSLAVFLAQVARDQVLAKHPAASIECRPATDRGQGQPLTLPDGGWSPVPGGGRVLSVSRPERSSSLASLDRILNAWEQKRERDEAERQRQEAERAARIRRGVRSGEVDSATVDLEAVAGVAGEVVRRQGAEVHVRCPQCRGTVKINPGKRAWSCFQCSVGGVGDAAAYLLARWLRENTDPAQVFGVLREAGAGVAHV